MLTLGMAQQESALIKISGFSPTSADFTDLVNEGTRLLMRRGESRATTRRMCACVYNACVTMPRSVETVLAWNRGRHSGQVRNNWYGFDSIHRGDCDHAGRVTCHSDLTAAQGNNSSVFNPIDPVTPKYLRFYISNSGDIGKTIRIFGKDSGGQTLRGQRTDGTFQEGLVLSLAMPYVQTPYTIHYIDHILKDVTEGPVRGYQWDGSVLWDLAYYEPNEQAPDYTTYTLHGGCWGTCFGATPYRISALVKLRFVPARYADDLVLIDNVDALRCAMQAAKYGDGGDAENREIFLAMAVKELNLDLWTRDEETAQPITNAVFGGTNIGRQRCF